MVTFSLTVIGFCLLIGFAVRPAALGGAGFMLFVCLTQPALPNLYPPAPAVTGHALLVNKDFIEMIALLAMAAVGTGRWAGIDSFIEPYLVSFYESKFGKKDEKKDATEESKK